MRPDERFINFSFHSKNLCGNTLLLLSMLITNLPIKSYQIPKAILILYTMCINPLRANPQNGHTLKQFVCKLHQRQYYFHNIAQEKTIHETMYPCTFEQVGCKFYVYMFVYLVCWKTKFFREYSLVLNCMFIIPNRPNQRVVRKCALERVSNSNLQL